MNKTTIKKMKKAAMFLILAGVLAGCGNNNDKAPVVQATVSARDVKVVQVIGIGKVEPEHAIVGLASATGGIVAAVLKQEGDRVHANEVLVKLDNDKELLKVEQTKTQVRTQESQLAIEKSNLQEAEARLKNKQKQLVASENLLSKGAESSQSYDDLATDVAVLEAGLARNLANVRLAESQLDELKVQLRQSEDEAGKKNLRAPGDGIVLEIKVKPGEAISQFSEYTEFAPVGEKIVRAEVDETFVSKLSVGQSVDIRFTGTDKVVAKGKIGLLSPYLKKKSLFSVKASDQEDRMVREVKIVLEGNTDLIINEKVECIIHVK
jgi:multidrug resistance efflux pump